MSRIPIRLRLVLAFGGVTALLLITAAIFVYQRLEADLDASAERGLNARLAGLVTVVRDDGDDLGDPVQDPLDTATEEGFVQVLDDRGDVAGGNRPALEEEPILSPAEVEALISGELTSIERHVPQVAETLRLKAAPASDDGVIYTAIAGASLTDREDALSDLLLALVIAGPVGLLLACAAGYLVAGAALRPVDEMRASADALAVDEPGGRLPGSPARDQISALGDTLNALLRRVDEALRRERSFAADAADELRTPLTALRTNLDTVLRQEGSSGESHRAVRSAVRRADDLVRVADDLRVIARAADNSLPLRLASVDLEELLGSVASRHESRAEATGRSLVLAVPDGSAVTADRAWLERALDEMVENAVVHGAGVITVGAVARPGGVEVHVTDEGPGLSAGSGFDGSRRIGRRSAGYPGTGGMGLLIVDAVARGHGGRAHSVDRPEGGADVWVWLPSPPPTEDGQADGGSERGAGRGAGRGRR